jgi:hypothetical protein
MRYAFPAAAAAAAADVRTPFRSQNYLSKNKESAAEGTCFWRSALSPSPGYMNLAAYLRNCHGFLSFSKLHATNIWWQQ